MDARLSISPLTTRAEAPSAVEHQVRADVAVLVVVLGLADAAVRREQPPGADVAQARRHCLQALRHLQAVKPLLHRHWLHPVGAQAPLQLLLWRKQAREAGAVAVADAAAVRPVPVEAAEVDEVAALRPVAPRCRASRSSTYCWLPASV